MRDRSASMIPGRSGRSMIPGRSGRSMIPGRSGRSGVRLLSLLSALAVAGSLVVMAAGPAGARSKPTVVTATETDFHIKLSKTSFSPGKYKFTAVNAGQVTHALEITGPGLSAPHTGNFQPGQKSSLTVTLKKGAYDIFCPVPGHKALGMNVNIKVGVRGSGGVR
jgi:uncharacterized cupredoxin-like copper-binding protein